MHMITKELIQDAEAENIKVQVPFIARSLRLLAGVAACQGDDAVACVLYEESLAIAGELDYKWYIAACLEDLASYERRATARSARQNHLPGQAFAARELA